MLSQRTFQLSARRALALGRRNPPSTAYFTASRNASFKTLPAQDSASILEEQRLRRPVSPHMTIYRPQITWLPSIVGRITGAAISGGLYLFFAAYATAPMFGWDPVGAEGVVAAAAGLPVAAKVAAKGLLGWVFSFHCLNGVRHVVWDFGKGINNVAVARSGWFVVGLSVCSAVALALY